MHKPVTLDGFDLKLLAVLQDDARLTNQALADRVGLGASQCSRRRVRLEAAGVIAGYRAVLDPEMLGFGITAFVQITLARHSPDNARQFRELVLRTAAIQQAYAVTGDADYMLKVVLTGLPALAALVNDVLLPHASVAHVRSLVGLERIKDVGALPTGDLR